MGLLFASVSGVVEAHMAALVREAQELCREAGVVAREEGTSLVISGTLHQLLRLDNAFSVGGLAVQPPAGKENLKSVVNCEGDQERSAEEKLNESVKQFASVSEITESQVIRLGFDKNRGLDTKSKNYEITNAAKFECDLCSFKTKRQSHMEKHIKMHEGNALIYACQEQGCDFRCIRNGDLTRHNLTYHLDHSKVFSCSICAYKSLDAKCFAKHIKYSHREKEVRKVLYECSKCPYKTMKILFFARHMKKHGVLVDSKTAKTETAVNLKCDLCEYEAKRVEHIHRHMDTVHSDERKYLCQTCGIGFKRGDALKLHNTTHSSSASQEALKEETEKHGCRLCQKVFHSFTQLMEHNISHQNENLVKCDICYKSFLNVVLLQKHIKSVHGASGNHVCEVCCKKFNTPFNLKRHLRTHQKHAENKLAFPCDSRDQREIRYYDQDNNSSHGELILTAAVVDEENNLGKGEFCLVEKSGFANGS